MATAFESETRIQRPAAEVWAALTDWSLAPIWMRGIDRIEADGPLAVGTQLTFAARGADRPARIMQIDDGRVLVLRSEQGFVVATYRYEVETVGDDLSMCRLRADYDIRGPARVAAPLIRQAIRRSDGGQPEALRALLEA